MGLWGSKKFRDVEKDLAKAGFEPVRQKGSHVVFKNKSGKSVTVPNHGGTDIAKGTMRSIAKQAGVDPEKLYGDQKDSAAQRNPMDLLREGNPPPGSRGPRASQEDPSQRRQGGRRGRDRGRGRGD
jgi:predicted RNA binding protein YcfA (HicA-like mRNA interferase family)